VTWAEGPQRGIETGGMVLLRLLVLTVAATVLVRSVNAESLLRATHRIGLERLGLVLGLALNTLPRLAEAASEVWTASKVRSGSTVARLRRLPGLGEVLLAHTARVAEEAAAAASLRGHSALTRIGNGLRSTIRVVVVTGPSGGGKTEAVVAATERLRSSGVPVAGFVQPGEFEGGRKLGFRLRDVASGEEAALAALGERGEGDFGTRFRFADVERVFAILMIFTACSMAFAHGSNDVANAVGPLAAVVSVVSSGGLVGEKSTMAWWILVLGGTGIVAGLATYGYRVIATVGEKITELTPSRGFAAELGAATTVVLASGTGLPISTTHTLVGAVLGVGVARGISAINLGIVGRIFVSWVVTIPAGAALTIVIFYVLRFLLG